METRTTARQTGETETGVSRSALAVGALTARYQDAPLPVIRVPRSVMVIGRQPQQVLETTGIADAFDIVFVETLEQGYSMVREAQPDLVVLWMPIDDVYACQVLSMLRLDEATSHIPLVTFDACCLQASAASMN